MATTANKQAATAAAAAPKFDPIAARDRIKQINELAKQHEDEKAALLASLASEGFVLVGEKRATENDMANPENWKRGDIVKCVSDESRYFTKGKEYMLTCGINSDDAIETCDDDGDSTTRDAAMFEFVRRPE